MQFHIQVSDKDNIQVLDLLIDTYNWFNLMNITRHAPINNVLLTTLCDEPLPRHIKGPYAEKIQTVPSFDTSTRSL